VQPFIIFAPPDRVPKALDSLGDGVAIVPISDLTDVEAGAQPAVLILTAELADGDLLESVPRHVTVLANGPEARTAADSIDRLFLDIDDLSDADAQLRAIRSAARVSASELARSRAASQLDELRGDLRGLNEIGMALMSERDPDVVLEMILNEARRLTVSDAGSLYLVDDRGDGSRTLHFLRAQNHSLPDLPRPDFSLPFDDSSLAGYVAFHGRPLVIKDAYRIPESEPYSFNPSFDKKQGYRARSMLIVPMKDHRDTVVGVLQLINKKSDSGAVIRDESSCKRHVLSYEKRDVDLVQSLAGQAAVSIENARLYEDIENLFEGFIKASVIAIDQRDPTTSGHSVRVATLTCDIAELADRASDGPFRDTQFSRDQMRELRYAGLLHDFGKVGVREDVLVKSKKLPPVLLERIEARFDLIRRTLESDFHKKRAEHLLKHGKDDFDTFLQGLEEEYENSQAQVDRFQEAIRESNVPKVLPEASAEILKEIATTTFRDFTDQQVPYVTSEELHFLSIPKVSLDPDERLQIESHVTHTYNFLMQIPWTSNLAQVADIAHGHHEKLDGTGYPRGIQASQIAIQTRIMTVSDIFDALTASDRPYKKALSAHRAIEILDMEAKAGMLDRSVVELVLASDVHQKIVETDWREL
jgi:HD-GYP domain-containing protein (c-di-GMP phosphodiesterase class II)